MTAIGGRNAEREVIPRWRSLATTVALGELSSAGPPTLPSEDDESELSRAELDWLENQTLSFAAGFVGTALVLRRPERAKEAAVFVLEHKDHVSEVVEEAAKRVVYEPSADVDAAPIDSEEAMDFEEAYGRVRELRQRLTRDPRNAVAWADLAREHATLGLHDRAQRELRVALGLAPESRFLLRAAARLLVTRDKPDAAHRLLLRAGSTRFDPWLLAAESAVAGAAGTSPRFARRGREVLASGRFPARHVTELASALATLELKAGNQKRARRLFEASLDDPTDNSLAQAEWAAEAIPNFAVPSESLEEPIAHEARARRFHDEGAWERVISESWRWHADQPFVSDATVFGSFAASMGTLDFEEAVRIARAGLRSSPGDVTLLNNLAYSLIELGRIKEAEESLGLVNEAHLSVSDRVAHLATLGLFAYRTARPAEGRRLYLQAVALARRPNLREMLALASILLAREEIRARGDMIAELLNNVSQTAHDVDHPAVKEWLGRLQGVRATEGVGA